VARLAPALLPLGLDLGDVVQAADHEVAARGGEADEPGPAEVVVVDEVPRNPTGKLLRRVLVERERERAAGRSPVVGASA